MLLKNWTLWSFFFFLKNIKNSPVLEGMGLCSETACNDEIINGFVFSSRRGSNHFDRFVVVHSVMLSEVPPCVVPMFETPVTFGTGCSFLNQLIGLCRHQGRVFEFHQNMLDLSSLHVVAVEQVIAQVWLVPHFGTNGTTYLVRSLSDWRSDSKDSGLSSTCFYQVDREACYRFEFFMYENLCFWFIKNRFLVTILRL